MYKEWLASRANPPPEPTSTMTLEDFKLSMGGEDPAVKKQKMENEKKEQADILSKKEEKKN